MITQEEITVSVPMLAGLMLFSSLYGLWFGSKLPRRKKD